jgi:hypothetical protein
MDHTVDIKYEIDYDVVSTYLFPICHLQGMFAYPGSSMYGFQKQLL